MMSLGSSDILFHLRTSPAAEKRPSRAVSFSGFAPASAPAAGATDTLARRRTRSHEISTSECTKGIHAIYGPFLLVHIIEIAPRRVIVFLSGFLPESAFRPPVPRESQPSWPHRSREGLCGRPQVRDLRQVYDSRHKHAVHASLR